MTTRLGRLAPSRDESGTTLIELLVTVVIMGLAFVIIVGGIGTAIIGSDIQKNQAGADVVLRTAAETMAYQACATTTANTYAPSPQPSRFTVKVVRVSHWDRDANAFVDSADGLPAEVRCSDTDTPLTDTGLQLVELSASPDSGRQATKTLEVVKRKPDRDPPTEAGPQP